MERTPNDEYRHEKEQRTSTGIYHHNTKERTYHTDVETTTIVLVQYIKDRPALASPTDNYCQLAILDSLTLINQSTRTKK